MSLLFASFTAEWHDYNCGFELQSICERSGSPPANATVAPIVPKSGGCEDSWKKINSKVRTMCQSGDNLV